MTHSPGSATLHGYNHILNGSVHVYTGCSNTVTPNNTTPVYQCKCDASYDVKDSSEDVLNKLYFGFTITMSSLSAIAAPLLIWMIVQFKLRTEARNLLIYLSVSDTVMALFNILGIVWYASGKDDLLCKIQSVGAFTSAIASFLWTLFIGLNVFLIVIFKNKVITKELKILSHFIGWGVPVAVGIAAASSNVLGYDKCIQVMTTCWIDPCSVNRRVDKLLFWQMITGKFWELSIYIIVMVLYTSMRRMSRSRASSTTRSMTNFKSANQKLIFVPLVFIIARMWGTIRFLCGLSQSQIAKTIGAYLAPIQGLGDSAQGFLNCIVFIITTPTIRERLTRQRIKHRPPTSNPNDQTARRTTHSVPNGNSELLESAT